MSEDTLAGLLQGCRAGQAGAVDELVGTYRPAVFRFALSFLDDPAEADDAAQEAFLNALRSLHRYRGDAAFTTWLYTITANVCRARLRQRRVRQRLTQTLHTLLRLGPAQGAPAEQQALRHEAQAAVRQAIAALPEPQRLAVVLRYYHDLPIADIAKILQVSERTVHKRLQGAHERLRAMLSGRADER